MITTFNSLFIFFPFLNKTLQLKNARGYTLQCSHYLPSSVPEDISLVLYIAMEIGISFFVDTAIPSRWSLYDSKL
jgi:hypothetical protein